MREWLSRFCEARAEGWAGAVVFRISLLLGMQKLCGPGSKRFQSKRF